MWAFSHICLIVYRISIMFDYASEFVWRVQPNPFQGGGGPIWILPKLSGLNGWRRFMCLDDRTVVLYLVHAMTIAYSYQGNNHSLTHTKCCPDHYCLLQSLPWRIFSCTALWCSLGRLPSVISADPFILIPLWFGSLLNFMLIKILLTVWI